MEPKAMGESMDAIGKMLDSLWELGLQRSIAIQARKTATIEERVQQLESQLDLTHRILRDLFSHLGKNLSDQHLRDAAASFAQVVIEKRPKTEESVGKVKSLPEPDATDALRCLACGVAMTEDDTKCSACGWTYASNNDTP